MTRRLWKAIGARWDAFWLRMDRDRDATLIKRQIKENQRLHRPTKYLWAALRALRAGQLRVVR